MGMRRRIAERPVATDAQIAPDTQNSDSPRRGRVSAAEIAPSRVRF